MGLAPSRVRSRGYNNLRPRNQKLTTSWKPLGATVVPEDPGVLLGTVRACTSGQKRFSGLTCEYAERGAAACNG